MLKKNGRTLATDDVLIVIIAIDFSCKGDNKYKATQDGGYRASAGEGGTTAHACTFQCFTRLINLKRMTDLPCY